MTGTGRIAVLTPVGYGFIEPNHESFVRLFFHRSEVQGASFDRDLRVGMPVAFDRGVDERGRARAVNVRVLDEVRA